MSINQQQFDQLTEMGISLWQLRDNANQSKNTSAQLKEYLSIDLKALASQQLFCDILLSTKLSIGEIIQQNDHLDFGQFNWYFIDESEKAEITWHDQQLFTPSLADIAQSPVLKKQLWQILSNHHVE